MTFDPTFHLGDLLAILAIGGGAYQRVAGTLKTIEGFIQESRNDRAHLHQRIEALESALRTIQGGL